MKTGGDGPRTRKRTGIMKTVRVIMYIFNVYVICVYRCAPSSIAILEDLNDKELLLGAGNAMSVPVVGAVLAEVFQKTTVWNISTKCRASALNLNTSTCTCFVIVMSLKVTLFIQI